MKPTASQPQKNSGPRTQRHPNEQTLRQANPVLPAQGPAPMKPNTDGNFVKPGSDAHPAVIGAQIAASNPTGGK